MDHAARIIQRIAEHRHAGMPGIAEQVQQFGQIGGDGNRINISARHHDMLYPHIAQRQNIAQKHPLIGAEMAIIETVIRQRKLQVLADAAIFDPKNFLESPKNSFPAGAVQCFRAVVFLGQGN